MEFKRFGQSVIVRIDKGEEILSQLKQVAECEHIKLASVQALGAVNKFITGVYNVEEKKYYANQFEGAYEIVSFTGTISTMNNEYYAHIHMSAGDETGKVFGGHLNEAYVSATCELVISIIDGQVDRFADEEIGLNVFRF